jgi:hypothetical protein
MYIRSCEHQLSRTTQKNLTSSRSRSSLHRLVLILLHIDDRSSLGGNERFAPFGIGSLVPGVGYRARERGREGRGQLARTEGSSGGKKNWTNRDMQTVSLRSESNPGEQESQLRIREMEIRDERTDIWLITLSK